MIHNESDARKYIDEKRVLPLIQALTTAVAYTKPEDPVQFLTSILKILKESRDSNGSVLVCFTEEDIKAMISSLDPFNKGKITREQLESCLINFGTDKNLAEEIIGDKKGPFDIKDIAAYVNEGVKLTLFPK